MVISPIKPSGGTMVQCTLCGLSAPEEGDTSPCLSPSFLALLTLGEGTILCPNCCFHCTIILEFHKMMVSISDACSFMSIVMEQALDHLLASKVNARRNNHFMVKNLVATSDVQFTVGLFFLQTIVNIDILPLTRSKAGGVYDQIAGLLQDYAILIHNKNHPLLSQSVEMLQPHLEHLKGFPQDLTQLETHYKRCLLAIQCVEELWFSQTPPTMQMLTDLTHVYIQIIKLTAPYAKQSVDELYKNAMDGKINNHLFDDFLTAIHKLDTYSPLAKDMLELKACHFTPKIIADFYPILKI